MWCWYPFSESGNWPLFFFFYFWTFSGLLSMKQTTEVHVSDVSELVMYTTHVSCNITYLLDPNIKNWFHRRIVFKKNLIYVVFIRCLNHPPPKSQEKKTHKKQNGRWKNAAHSLSLIKPDMVIQHPILFIRINSVNKIQMKC